MQNSDPRDRIVYPIHKRMIDSYILPIDFRFIFQIKVYCNDPKFLDR